MNMHLVVVRPFGSFSRGDTIVDPKRVAEILASYHAANVVRVNMGGMARPQPAPVSQPAASPGSAPVVEPEPARVAEKEH